MSELSVDPVNATRTGRWNRGGQLFRWLMVALAASALIGMLAFGRLGASPEMLEESIRSGDVESVTTGERVTMDGGDPTLRVGWNRGLVKRWSDVPLGGGRDELIAGWEEQGVEVTSVPSIGGAQFYAWSAPSPWVALAATALLLALGRILGTQPLRMRRWGWVWMLSIPLLGPLLFFVLGEAAGRGERKASLPVDAAGQAVDRRFDGLVGFWVAIALWGLLSLTVRWLPFL